MKYNLYFCCKHLPLSYSDYGKIRGAMSQFSWSATTTASTNSTRETLSDIRCNNLINCKTFDFLARTKYF